MVPGLLILLAVAPLPRPFDEERLLLDRRLETLRRILPDGANPAADRALVLELAEQARLASVEIQAQAPVESGSRGEVPLEVTAVGRFGDIDRFFRQVALSHRLLDVESVTLAASQEDLIRLRTVVRVPFRPLRAPLPPPPEGPRAHLGGVPRPAAEAYLRDQAMALAKAETIAQIRRARRNPRLFLSETAAVVRDRPVVLNYASVADDFTIRGLAVGEGPLRALESRFERGFFRITEFLMARQGACHRFEVRGRCPVVGLDAELPLPAEDPFEQDEAPCRVDRDQGRALTVKAPNPKKPGSGLLSLRFRELDLADAFRILHLLTNQAFVVDGDVTGRVSADVGRLSLEEVLAAFRRSGVEVSEPGAVRRVSMGRGAPSATPARGGTPTASFSLKRAEAREILAVMTDIDPTLAALGPPGSLGRVSLWAKDLPVADLRAAVIGAVGLEERFEEGRRILERAPGSADALVPVAGTPPPERRLALRPEDLAVVEFELAALATAGSGWIACAYSPTGTLNAYRAGDRLADAIVKAVESTDVVLEGDDGLVRVPIAVMAR
jgi:hypothetical protein